MAPTGATDATVFDGLVVVALAFAAIASASVNVLYEDASGAPSVHSFDL
jgi:hypothetical protein